VHPECNNPMICTYNNNHLSPNGIQSGNQRWYGLVYLVYKRLVNLVQGPENNRVASGTLVGRLTFREKVHIKVQETMGTLQGPLRQHCVLRGGLLKRLKA